MPAHITYVIHGKNSRNEPVSFPFKAVSKPNPEAALWIIRQTYPSVTEDSVYVTIPAAHKYPKLEAAPAKAKTMSTTPLRRVRRAS